MNDEVKTNKSKETENYEHLDLEFNMEEIDQESFKTVSLGDGKKLVIGRNTKTDELQGLKFLLPIKKND